MLAFAALVEHAKTRYWIGWVRACGGWPGDMEKGMRRAEAHTLASWQHMATLMGAQLGYTAGSNGSSLLIDLSFWGLSFHFACIFGPNVLFPYKTK